MDVRRFTSSGLAAFQRFLDSCTTDAPLPHPASALTDPLLSEPIPSDVTIEQRAFGTRFELAEYLDQAFESGGYRPPRADAGLWAWLACYYFLEICPVKASGKLDPGASARWIPQSSDWRRYYRHLVAGPYNIYRAHRDNPMRALALLCQRPGRPGDLVEQLASRQQIVTSPSVIGTATAWFVDPATGKQRRGANSKGKGGARRFFAVVEQFDVTWDLSLVPENDLRIMLPDEFQLSA
jgi:hypothetical protein